MYSKRLKGHTYLRPSYLKNFKNENTLNRTTKQRSECKLKPLKKRRFISENLSWPFHFHIEQTAKAIKTTNTTKKKRTKTHSRNKWSKKQNRTHSGEKAPQYNQRRWPSGPTKGENSDPVQPMKATGPTKQGDALNCNSKKTISNRSDDSVSTPLPMKVVATARWLEPLEKQRKMEPDTCFDFLNDDDGPRALVSKAKIAASQPDEVLAGTNWST